jgi:WD40 repeat protein
MIWDLTQRTQLQAWSFPFTVNSIAFAPDGRHLATANNDGTFYFFRLERSPSQ